MKLLSKSNLTLIFLILLSFLLLLVGYRYATTDNPHFAGATSSEDYYRARVLEASPLTEHVNEIGGLEIKSWTFSLRARLLDGFMRGEEITIDNQRLEDNSPARVYPFQEGDEIFVTFNFDEKDQVVWYASDHVRSGSMSLLVVFFLLLLILFGRRKGLYTVVTLVFTVVAVFLVLIPSIIKGTNIYGMTLLVSAYVILMTLGIVSGISRKSLAAAVGCFTGVGIAGLLTVVMQRVMHISGLVNEESSFVLLINPESPIDLRGVIFAGIAIGALGAVMDVAMSIASSLEELILHAPGLPARDIFCSGMRIGRDVMGTMANTLILAYAGSSLNVILLLMAYNQSPATILNREMVAVEVLQAVAGSVGILCAVPATALVTVLFFRFWKDGKRPGLPTEGTSS